MIVQPISSGLFELQNWNSTSVNNSSSSLPSGPGYPIMTFFEAIIKVFVSSCIFCYFLTFPPIPATQRLTASVKRWRTENRKTILLWLSSLKSKPGGEESKNRPQAWTTDEGEYRCIEYAMNLRKATRPGDYKNAPEKRGGKDRA